MKRNNGIWISIFVFFIFMALSSPAFALVYEHPLTKDGDMEISLSLNKSSKDYEITGYQSSFYQKIQASFDKTVIGLNINKKISSRINVFGKFGYNIDGSSPSPNIETLPDWMRRYDTGEYELDQGYFAGAGCDVKVFENNTYELHAYGQVDYTITEERSSNGNWEYIARNGAWLTADLEEKIDWSGYEIAVGALVISPLSLKFSVFGGIEFTAFSDISGSHSMKYTPRGFENATTFTGFDDDIDVECKDAISFRAGAIYNLNDKWMVSANATFGNERTLGISGGIKF